MTLCGTGAYAATRIGEPHLGDAPTTSEWWGVFINVGIYSKRFTCRESCCVNRQVSSYFSWLLCIKVMFFPKYAPNGLRGVGGKLAYVAQNCQLLEHIPRWGFPWFLLWLLPSVHQLFEGCSGRHYPWGTPTDKNLGGSSPVNAVPTQRHTSCWSVSPEIALSARLKESFDVWGVAPSCWNHCSSRSIPLRRPSDAQNFLSTAT